MSELTTDQLDALNGIELGIRRWVAIAEMLGETRHMDADRMRAAFEEAGIGLERLADELQNITHSEGAMA